MNNDWITWNGGQCPVPGKRVQIQLRDQTRYEAEKMVVRVRPLSWKKGDDGNHFAETSIGRYRVIRMSYGRWAWDFEHEGLRVCDNEKEAFSAAQADYERRILSPVEIIPASQIKAEGN